LRSAELLKQIREQIESVLNSAPEDIPKSLEATANDITDRIQSGQAALDAAKKVSNDLLNPMYPSERDVHLSTYKHTLFIPPSPVNDDTVLVDRSSSPTRVNLSISVTLSPPIGPLQAAAPNKLGRWFVGFRARKCGSPTRPSSFHYGPKLAILPLNITTI
jgi:hypothetical protein